MPDIPDFQGKLLSGLTFFKFFLRFEIVKFHNLNMASSDTASIINLNETYRNLNRILFSMLFPIPQCADRIQGK